MPIPLIERKKQDALVDVLSSLDEKIQHNNEINNHLEQQAQALFDYFYESANNAFPFTNLVQVLGGGTPKTSNPEFWNGDIPFFTPKDIGTPYTLHTEKYITNSGITHCNSRLYPVGTTFVTARGTVGKVSLAGVPMAMNQSCYALTSDIIDPILVYNPTRVRYYYKVQKNITEVSTMSRHSSSTNELCNPRLKALILQAVDNQPSANDSPITRREDYGRSKC